MEKSYLLLKLKACAAQLVTLFESLDRKTPCEPITIITQRYLGILRFCRWSKFVHRQKLALFISEIRVEISHSMFCTNRHKMDITTAGRPGSSDVPRNPLTRWDVSSIPANGIFLTKNTKKQK